MSTVNSPAGNEVALIAGPTASGKSDLAIRLALALREAGRDTVVINADSAQVYADLAVLSARPAEAEMHGVPHRLFGAWDGAHACSAANWAAAAKREIANAHAVHALPILVGGTGLYLRTLLDGISPIPAIDQNVRDEVRALPVDQAFAALALEDPQSAARLAPADSQRIARALEVVRSTGRPMQHWHQQINGGIGDTITLFPLVLMPERAELYARCDARFAAMLGHGAIEEVAALLARKLDRDLPVMRAIGVPEVSAFLAGAIPYAQMLAMGQQSTRNYAKRQFTWLRNQLPGDWPRTHPDDINLASQFAIILRQM